MRYISSNADLVVSFLGDLTELNETLYVDNPCGGPLHIVLDDGNLDDNSILFCHRFMRLNPSRNNTLTTIISKQILDYLMIMTEPQRLVWWLEDRDSPDLDNLIRKVENGQVKEREDGCYDRSIETYDKETNEWVSCWSSKE